MKSAIVFWLAGWMFTCGFSVGDQSLNDIYIRHGIVKVFASNLIIWPLVLGSSASRQIQGVKK